MHEHNNSFNRTLTKLVTILTKRFFPYLNPTSYLKYKARQNVTWTTPENTVKCSNPSTTLTLAVVRTRRSCATVE